MYPGGFVVLVLVGGIVITCWLSIITFVIWKNNQFLHKLFPVKGRHFRDTLEEVLEDFKKLEEFQKKNRLCVQKVELKRYNPYGDTGGDQSFSAVLLNGYDDGVVITSLHSRTGTRVFAKPVKGGKVGDFRFSKEEEELVLETVKK
ncbi:MAG: DUF4446 family protein [Armatimonadetes bacterium]|nr:MAG: DUF4446 family protein [Armatimonadota bacterium]